MSFDERNRDGELLYWNRIDEPRCLDRPCDRIFWARVDAGMTQKELSWRARVGRSTISRLERGITQPRYITSLWRIAEALNVTVDWILLGGKKDVR